MTNLGTWNLMDAVQLCTEIEAIAPDFGCHLALTGGTLYKGGKNRKDLDILFYRIRQAPEINITGLLAALERLGIQTVKHHGWMYKALYERSEGRQTITRSIDIFFPETAGNDGYESQGSALDSISELAFVEENASFS